MKRFPLLLFRFGLLLAALIVSAPAAATKLAITFQTPSEFTPVSVCVLTPRIDEDNRRVHFSSIQSWFEEVGGFPKASAQVEYRLIRDESKGSMVPTCAALRKKIDKRNQYEAEKRKTEKEQQKKGKPPPAAGTPPPELDQGEQELARACEGLREIEKKPKLDCLHGESNTCDSRFIVQPNDKMMCTGNAHVDKTATDSRRTVFLSLRSLYAASPDVRSIELRGRKLVVTLEEAVDIGDERIATVQAAVAGGDYLPSESALGGGSELLLPIVPRCARHMVTVTGSDFTPHQPDPTFESTFTFETAVGDISACAKQEAASLFDLVIPYQLDRRSALTLSVPDAKSSKSLVFAAEWEGALPPERIALRAKRIRFTWEVHCSYPWDSCPDATLPDSGARCEPDDPKPSRRQCSYTCSAAKDMKTAPSFTLPQRVVFVLHDDKNAATHDGSDAEAAARRDTEEPSGFTESWSEMLYQSGDLLRSYSALADRHVRVDFKDWTKPDFATIGQKVEYVEVRSPKGELYRLAPVEDDYVRLGMPGFTCVDHISYRPVGDRKYEERVVDDKGGVVTLERPEETVTDLISTGLSVGGGLKPSAGEMEGQKQQITGFAWLDFVVGWRELRNSSPHGLVPHLEARAGLLYSSSSYLTRHFDSEEGTPILDSVPYLWVPLTAGPYWDLPFGTYLSLGAGAAFGLPSSRSDAELAPQQWALALLGAFGVRVPKTPVNVELMLKTFAGQVYDIHFKDGGRQPTTEPETLWPLFVGVGVRVGN